MLFSKRTIVGILLLQSILVSNNLFAQSISQDVIAASGDYFINSNGSLSWTLGEAIVETIENGNLILTQGFQQPDKITLTSIKEPLGKDYDITIFPNPTVDIINIDLANGDEEIITIHLYDMQGNKLINQKFQQRLFQLDLSSLASANYLLSLRRLNGELITTYLINKT